MGGFSTVMHIMPSQLAPKFLLLNQPLPTGITIQFIAGTTITAGQVVSIHTDGNVYPSSPSYPNVIGVAVDSASAGDLVSVLVLGVAQVTADGPVAPGSPVTYSSATPGRVIEYPGHSHGVTESTNSFVVSVGTDTGYNVNSNGIITHTHTTTTDSALTSVSVNTTLTWVLGVALSSASDAGETITVLVLPSRG